MYIQKEQCLWCFWRDWNRNLHHFRMEFKAQVNVSAQDESFRFILQFLKPHCGIFRVDMSQRVVKYKKHNITNKLLLTLGSTLTKPCFKINTSDSPMRLFTSDTLELSTDRYPIPNDTARRPKKWLSIHNRCLCRKNIETFNFGQHSFIPVGHSQRLMLALAILLLTAVFYTAIESMFAEFKTNLATEFYRFRGFRWGTESPYSLRAWFTKGLHKTESAKVAQNAGQVEMCL